MFFTKVASWFLTERGRTFSLCVVSGASVGAFCIPYVPNTFLLEQYKNVVHLYRKGMTVPVPPHLVKRFHKAIELAEIPKDEVHLYKPFSVFGFDIFHAGSSYSRFGCLIGLPVNFAYNDVEDIDKHSIKVSGESVPWDLPEAKKFLDSVVLSEKAQIYAMAREMGMTQTPQLLLDSMYGTISILMAYAIGAKLNIAYNLYAKPLRLRFVMYSLISAFCLTNYFLVKDFTQVYFERKVDEQLKQKNTMLAEGGIEFYNKILQRNVALRKLMGNEGKHLYSVLGNENYLIRQRHLPLVQRKAFFEGNMEEIA